MSSSIHQDLQSQLLQIDNLTFSIASVFLWLAIGTSCFIIFSIIVPLFRNYETFQKKAEFVCYFTGMLHAAVSSSLGYYGIYYTCDGWEQGKTPINDEYCLTHPKDIHYKLLLHTAGFLIYDLIIYGALVGAKGTLANQTYIHHVLGASGFYLTLYTEDVTVLHGVMSLLLEASTVFLDLRWFVYEFKVTNPIIPLLNTGGLFVAYLSSRVFFQTYISFYIAYPRFYEIWVL